MKIQDLLQKNAMILSLNATNKADAISEMVQKLVDTGYVTDFDTFKDGILAREALTTTGLGEGIAMPHSKNAAVKEAVVLFAKKDGGLDYESLDGQPTDLFFMIAAPDGANDTHLAALAELSKYLMKDGFADSLRTTTTPDQVLATFNAAEAATVEEAVAEINNDEDFVVAVTACTTGIAHTYMAEEALKKQAKELGVEIKVETNGASGIGNKLTAEDIKKAKGVIIAADKAVEMDRFDGKPLILKPVAAGIREPENLIKEALSGNLPTYKSTGQAQENESDEKLSIGKAFYKHLMSGVSSMLPFVIGGGIAIAIAFLIDNAMGVPKDQLSNLGSYHELASVFKQLGGAAFGFMLPILAGYIAYSIAEKPGLVAGFVAGAIASNGLAFGKVPFASGGEKTLALAGVPSGFLGALVGGFLAGGVILILKKVFSNVPRSLNGIVSILIYPVLGVLITGFLMLFVNIPMAAINSGLTNFLNSLSGANAVLLGALLGGMMAIDMGGPFNKAADAFSIGIFTDTGDGSLMAAVMAGGMVPPLAIALASTFFKNKFNENERKSGVTNYVMGISFITEGAIPFAAADPLRVIGSSVLGAAIAGGLTQFWNSAIPAPHGGIFVIPLAENPLFFLLSLAIGTVVSAVLLGLWKKPAVGQGK